MKNLNIQTLILKIFSIFIISFGASAQAPNIEWAVFLGGTEFDGAHDVIQTSDGGYLVVGESESSDLDVSGNNIGDEDFWIVKLNFDGTIIEWETNVGGSVADIAHAVRETANGNFVVAGFTMSNDNDIQHFVNQGNRDVWVVKIDGIINPGDILWERNYGGSGDDVATSIDQTSDGGFIVAGYSNSSNSGDFSRPNQGGLTNPSGTNDFWVLKLDEDGNLLWENNYGGSGDDLAYSIQQTSDGGYIVAGETASSNGHISGPFRGLWDYWIVKLSEDGDTIQWERNYGGSHIDQARSVRQTFDGSGNPDGYIVAGTTWSNNFDVSGNNSPGLPDYWVVRLNNNGNLLWQQTYGGSRHDWGQDIQQTIDGGYVITGTTWSVDGDVHNNPATNSWSYWVVKTDNLGSIEWRTALGGSSVDWSNSIQQTSDEGYILTGRTSSLDGDVQKPWIRGWDYWVVKLEPAVPPAPVSLWPRTYGNTISYYRQADDIVVDDDENVYVVGTLHQGDISNEDSSFFSTGEGYIMKYDKLGNLLWIDYFPSNMHHLSDGPQAKIEIFGNNLYVLSNGGFLLGYDENGSWLFSPYEIGSSLTSDYTSLDIDKSTGDLYLSARFVNNFQNNDYTITPATGSSNVIFKFDQGGAYIDHAEIEGGPYVWVRDITYSESLSKLFVSGSANNGDVADFGPQQVNDAYFGAEYDTSGGIIFDSVLSSPDYLGELVYNNNNNELFVDWAGDIYLFDQGFGDPNPLMVYSNTAENVIDFMYNHNTNELFAAMGSSNPLGMYGTTDSFYLKIDNNNQGSPALAWEITLSPSIHPEAIYYNSQSDYVYVSGMYYNSTNLDAFSINSYGSSLNDIFIARIEDQGAFAEFKIAEEIVGFNKEKQKELLFMLYPNPTDNLLYVESRTDIKVESLTLVSVEGNVILSAKNPEKNPSLSMDLVSVKQGIYFMHITAENGETVVHKILKK